MRASHPPLLDADVFSLLYDRTHTTIFRFIFGIHGGPIEEVEDLTADTFFRAWRARHRFSGDERDALCWLFTIARHLVIDAHRHKKASSADQMIRLDESNCETVVDTNQGTPEEQAALQDQFNHLWQMLHLLPQEKREMLVLRYMIGWKVKDIADFMHKEEHTISVHIKRSLEQIRQDWSKV